MLNEANISYGTIVSEHVKKPKKQIFYSEKRIIAYNTL